MILFKGLSGEQNVITFESRFSTPTPILVCVLESYTGLRIWSDEMVVSNGEYFFGYPRVCDHFGFEIRDKNGEGLYLKIDTHYPVGLSIESLDRFNLLKNYKYPGSIGGVGYHEAYPLVTIMSGGEYNHENCRVSPGDVVIDIGANLGFFSYLSILSGAKMVYAFEPSAREYRAIVDNFSGLENLGVENLAVWSQQTELLLDIHPGSSIMNRIDRTKNVSVGSGSKQTCRAVNLEEYCNQMGIDGINYLKMDCEASEWEIFSSLSDNFVGGIDKIAMEYHNESGDDRLKNLYNRLCGCGFSVSVDLDNNTCGMLYAWKV